MYVDLHLLHECTTLHGVYRACDPSTMCTDMYSGIAPAHQNAQHCNYDGTTVYTHQCIYTEEREGGSEGVWFHSYRCVKLHDDSDAPELGIFNDSFDHVVSVDMVIIIRPLQSIINSSHTPLK